MTKPAKVNPYISGLQIQLLSFINASIKGKLMSFENADAISKAVVELVALVNNKKVISPDTLRKFARVIRNCTDKAISVDRLQNVAARMIGYVDWHAVVHSTDESKRVTNLSFGRMLNMPNILTNQRHGYAQSINSNEKKSK